jgi:hypothetical protein
MPPLAKNAYPSSSHPVLLLSAASRATTTLLDECEKSTELWILRVDTLSAALRVLRTSRVSVVMTGPGVCAIEVSAVLAALAQWQPKVPALVIRTPSNDHLETWKFHNVTTLDFPFSPGLLSRAVNVAVGLRGLRGSTN